MNERLLPLPDPLLPLGEHRACLLVTDLVGSTRLARQLPLGSYVALMTDLIQLLILHFEAYGAQVLQHQGDAVVCMWPPEQCAQAAQAALQGHTRAANLSLAALLGLHLELRVGLAVGEVISGPVGGILSAYGLPVNLARRLCSAARPGETLACPSFPDTVAEVRLVEREVSDLPGFEDLSRVYGVLESAAEQSATGRYSGMKTG